MNIRAFKYLMAMLIPISVGLSFNTDGLGTFRTVIAGFIFIPLLELLIPPNHGNFKKAEREIAAKDRMYDIILYLTVPLQYFYVIYYIISIDQHQLTDIEFWGKTSALGMLCGVLGINVAHELGHRRTRFERILARLLLFSTLYPHFYIEHNFGHHKHVGTPEDPATARFNEPVYQFWLRSVWFSWLSAWEIESGRNTRRGGKWWQNEMIFNTVVVSFILIAVYLYAGILPLFGFIVASIIGILLLETVNYIEHYGLSRKKVSDHRYENTQPIHSWNSDHVLGRMMLFELTRHSDHHANPQRKYQQLEYHEDSPQLPTGYPGMMLLALFPPLWFRIMNPRIIQEEIQIHPEVQS